MFHKKTINDYDIAGKIVFLRADFNVPLNKAGKIVSNFRIMQSLPTIVALQEKGCKVVIVSHLGRPKGEVNKDLSLSIVAKELEVLLKQHIVFVDDCVGEKVKQATENMQPGDILMLENVRFYKEEKANDPEFAKRLVESCGAEVAVQDCFGAVHRAHASVVGVAKYIPVVAGLLLEKEIVEITKVMEEPGRPLMAIIGGAKIADKIDIINKFIDSAEILVIGGAMANTFLKAQGVEVGDSVVDNEEIDTALDIMHKVREVSRSRDFIFYLPQDGVVTDKLDSQTTTRIVDWDTHVIADVEAYPKPPGLTATQVKKHEKIVDIGPFSGAFIAGAMQMVKTVIWNGTMGITEVPSLHGTIGPFAHGTELIIDSLVGKFGNRPFSLLGGGDTAAYVVNQGMSDMFDHVSTGGGASLELMAGRDLPGVDVLINKED